jgi:hypothetical protein
MSTLLFPHFLLLLLLPWVLPCVCLLQVKVKRRGSDKKFVASVLAVGTECDIGE